MMLVSFLLLVSVFGSKVKAINNLEGTHRQITKSIRDGGISSIDSMTEHQYLGKSGFFEDFYF